MLRLNFHVISIFCLHRLHRALYNLLWKNLFHGKIKNWKKVLVKERKKTQVQRRKKEYHSVKKRKKILCESDQYWLSSTLASRFQTKKCSSNQNVSYIYTQFIFRFFHFCRGFCLRLWQLCSLLCRPRQRLTERSKKKKRCLQSGAHQLCIGDGSCCNGLLFPGDLDPSSLTRGGPVVSLVWGEIICWCGASCLRTFMSYHNHI